MPATHRTPPAQLLFALLFGAAAGAAVLWFLAPTVGRNAGPANDPDAAPRPVAPRSGLDADETESVNLFKAVKDSVVNVDTVRLVRRLDMRVVAQQTGTGSGFFWDEDGRIVTNFHVVKDAVSGQRGLRVVLADRTAYAAELVGVAPEFDLAVLRVRVTREQSRPLRQGSSKDLEVGQKAYAIGNPFGLSLTMTKGIVSALDREIESLTDRPISGAIQTDAPINPGNSGGPLLDKDGRLIGVNTSIVGPAGGNVGIGFAIPADTVNQVVPELIRNGKVLKPDAGVRFVDDQLLRRNGFAKGAMVQAVYPDSPAAKAGLRGVRADPQTGEVDPGDLIVSLNGEEVRSGQELLKTLQQKFKPGDEVTLGVERAGETVQVKLTLRGI